MTAQEVGVLDELDRAWSEIQEWLRELLRDETDDLVAEELLVFPGIEELVVTAQRSGRSRQQETSMSA